MQNDLRYAARQLRRSPGFALTAILTLALSIGLATAVFCVMDAVILKPLPYSHPERILRVDSLSGMNYSQPDSWPEYCDERSGLRSLEALAGFVTDSINLDMSSGSSHLNEVATTDNFFSVFAVHPLLGRTFLPGEQEAGRNDVVVLSYEVWQKYFSADKSIVGKSVHLDGINTIIVGVMPAGFRYPVSMKDAVYRPLHLQREQIERRGNHWLRMVGRLREGVSVEQAQAERQQLMQAMAIANPRFDEGRSSRIQRLDKVLDQSARGPLWILLAAVAAVLAIGCINIAGLLLARSVRREREIALRIAIGAGRKRILSQVLTESLLLAIAGAVLGILLASALLQLMQDFLLHALDRGFYIHMNWLVLSAAVMLSVLTSLLAAILPALYLSSTDPNHVLKSGGNAGSSRAHTRLRSGFVITQVAFTLVLLFVAGMLIRTVSNLRHVDLGFDPSHVLIVDVNLSMGDYKGRDALLSLYYPLVERVQQIPGVKAAGFTTMIPIEGAGYGSNEDVHIAGQPPYPDYQEMLAEVRYITPGYLDAMSLKLTNGRTLNSALDASSNKAGTILVNQAFVRKFFPAGQNPIGAHLDDAEKDEEKSSIVGVITNLRQSVYQSPMAEMDILADEMPVRMRTFWFSSMTLAVQTQGDPRQIIPALRNAFHQVDPHVPFENPQVMTDTLSDTLVFERMEGWLFGIFAGMALLLALVGLYGLISHEVEQSTRDIGVRMALGATRTGILAMVQTRVAKMLAAGVAAGLLLAFVARRVLYMAIYFDAQKESGSFLLLALGMILAGLIAAMIPALRAASVQPMQALRNE